MSVYNDSDYKTYIRSWVADRPGNGRGEYRRMAATLGVSTTLISQVVNGEKHFSSELANSVCDYLGLTDREADHFLNLVEYARAGTFAYKQRLKRRIEASREQALKLKKRIVIDRELTDIEAATYYSNWMYTGLTNFAACEPKFDLLETANRFNVPVQALAKALEFLLEAQILEKKGDRVDVGAKHTHIASDSPFTSKHHQNWRLQGFNKMAYANDNDLFFTSPMSISREVADHIRREIPNFIEKTMKLVGPSPSEIVRCLNIDWFGY